MTEDEGLGARGGGGARGQADRQRTTRRAMEDAALAEAAAAGGGQSEGVPALGRVEAGSAPGNAGVEAADNPSGGAGVNHWQSATISRPDLGERGGGYFAMVEMTRMPMVLCDVRAGDLPIIFANGAFADLTGYGQDEILGRNCRFLQGALTDAATVGGVRDALRAGKPHACEVLNYRKDGTAFWNALFLGPIFDRAGTLLYFFASQLDVTRRRNSEDAFRQAQKMEAIGQLTAGVAHDFNNALQVVLGNHERALRMLSATEPARQAIARADRAGRHAAKLTAQLLSFARKTRLEPRSVVLNAVLTEFGDMLGNAMGDAVRLRYDLDPRLPPCVVDPTQVEMAVLNLLANARDAMPGGGKVVVATEARVVRPAAEGGYVKPGGDATPPGRYVALSVKDEGAGMPPEVLARATEPFFTTKEVGKGTGLGLSQVYGFARQSGGRMEIESGPGEGTTVLLLFPEAAEDDPAPPRPSEAEPVLTPKGPGETVLVVDDEEEVRELAVEHLSRCGYPVLSAASGEEALDVLGRAGGRIALLFTDLVMPGGMNGVVLAERVRAIHPGLPVLMATGFHAEMARADGGGQHTVLSKPYRASDLAERVRFVLNRAAAGTGGAKHEG